MTVHVRRSGPGDRERILRLMDAARGDGLTATQRAERGFVQGTMTEETLAAFERGPGVFVAMDGDDLAGFAMSSEPRDGLAGPPGLTVQAARAVLGDWRMFLYGPIAVDREHQGRGVLSVLLRTLCRELAGSFDVGVAFVEDANARSLAIHRHYPMTEIPGFKWEGRSYHVFTFDPGVVAGATPDGPTP